MIRTTKAERDAHVKASESMEGWMEDAMPWKHGYADAIKAIPNLVADLEDAETELKRLTLSERYMMEDAARGDTREMEMLRALEAISSGGSRGGNSSSVSWKKMLRVRAAIATAKGES